MIATRGEFKSGSQELKSQSSELKLELLSVHTIAGGNIVHVFKAPIDHTYHYIFKIWDPRTNTFIAEAKPLYPDEGMHEWKVFSISDDELIAHSYKCVRRLNSKTLDLIQESKENFDYLGKLPKTNQLLGMWSTWTCWVDAKTLTSKPIRNDIYGCCILPSGLIAIVPSKNDMVLKICDSELKELSSFSSKDHLNIWNTGELTALSDRFLVSDCVYLENDLKRGITIICDLTTGSSYFLEKEVENITLLDENIFICSIKDKLHFFTSENFHPTPLDVTLSCGPIRSIAYSPETQIITVAAQEKSSAIYIKCLSLKEVEDEIVNSVTQFLGSRPLAKIISQYGAHPLHFSLIYETKEMSKMKVLPEKLDLKEEVSVRRKHLKQALHRLFHHETSKQDVSQELKMPKP